MTTRDAAVGGDVANVRIARAGGEGAAVAVLAGAAAAASGRGTETATTLDVSGSALPTAAARERLWPPGASVGGIMTNWPEASAVASATVLPASRNSTFAFGAARPAMTASPVGSTVTTSKAGLTPGGAAFAAAISAPGASAAVWAADG